MNFPGASGTISIQNQNTASGTPTQNSFVQIGLRAQSPQLSNGPVGAPLDSDIVSVLISVTGTYTGVLTPRGTNDGQNWFALGVFQPLTNQSTGVQSTTIASGSTGVWSVNVQGLQAFRIDAEAAVTGSATVSLNASNAYPLSQQQANLPGGSVGTVAAATGTAVKAAAGLLVKVLVTSSGTAQTNIYDNAAAASGTIIGTIPANPVVGTVYVFNIAAASGIYAGAANTSAITVVYY